MPFEIVKNRYLTATTFSEGKQLYTIVPNSWKMCYEECHCFSNCKTTCLRKRIDVKDQKDYIYKDICALRERIILEDDSGDNQE